MELTEALQNALRRDVLRNQVTEWGSKGTREEIAEILTDLNGAMKARFGEYHYDPDGEAFVAKLKATFGSGK